MLLLQMKLCQKNFVLTNVMSFSLQQNELNSNIGQACIEMKEIEALNKELIAEENPFNGVKAGESK